MTDLTQGQILSILAVAIGVMIIFFIGWHIGRHGRQHWETDRVVEGKLANLSASSDASRNTSWGTTNEATANADGFSNPIGI